MLRCALHIISGRIIYNFAILENLRIFQNCLFTGGVVEENGLRTNPLRLTAFASSPEGGAFCYLSVSTNKAPPLGGAGTA